MLRSNSDSEDDASSLFDLFRGRVVYALERYLRLRMFGLRVFCVIFAALPPFHATQMRQLCNGAEFLKLLVRIRHDFLRNNRTLLVYQEA